MHYNAKLFDYAIILVVKGLKCGSFYQNLLYNNVFYLIIGCQAPGKLHIRKYPRLAISSTCIFFYEVGAEKPVSILRIRILTRLKISDAGSC